jgi:hypothetical protein
MKSSIAITLIIIVGIFSFVSGYSIGFKNGDIRTVGAQASATSSTESSGSAGYGSSSASGGYGESAAPSSGYGAATGGYGQ